MSAMIVGADKATIDSGEYDVAPVHESLCYAIVCQRIGLDSQRAIDRALFPAGTSLGWRFVERADLPEGWWEGDGAQYAAEAIGETDARKAPYPQPCFDHPETHVHVLAAC